MTRKTKRRQKRAQEAAKLKQAVALAGKVKPPATEAAKRAETALEGQDHE